MKHPSVASLLVLVFVLLAGGNPAAAQDWLWSVTGSGSDHDSGDRIAADSLGYVYVTGRFSGRIDFGTRPLYGTALWDTYVAKFDPAGTLVWATSITGAGNELPGDITVDREGNVFVVGTFEGSSNVNGQVVQSRGGTDIFVARFDPLGRTQWVATAGGTGNDVARACRLDTPYVADPGIYLHVTGSFEGRAFFGGDTANTIGGADMFLARYSAGNGGIVWIRTGGGPRFDEGLGLGIDNYGNSYVIGTFTDSARFLDNRISMASSDSGALFLVKIDFAGIPRTAAAIARYPRTMGRPGVAVDPDGNSYIAGSFYDSIRVASTWAYADSGRDAFLVRYNPFGGFRWIATYGDSLNDDGIGVDIDLNGGVLMTGSRDNTAGLTIDTGHVEHMFVARFLIASGAFDWERISAGNAQQRGLDVALDRSRNIYIGGLFTGTAFFDDQQIQASPRTSDMFLVKLGTSPGITTGTIPGTPLCAGQAVRVPYTVVGTFYANNTFTAQLSDTNGSFDTPLVIGQHPSSVSGTIDAFVPGSVAPGSRYRIRVVSVSPATTGSDNGVDIQVLPLPRPRITLEGNDTLCQGESVTLDAGEGYASYRWSNGATSRTITVATNGLFWVDVTSGGACIGRSDSVEILVGPIPQKPVIVQVGNQLQTSLAWLHQWYRDGEPIQGANRERYLPSASGIYSVRVWNQYGCTALSDPYTYTSLGIARDELGEALSIGYDHVARRITVAVRTSRQFDQFDVQLVDVAGRVLVRQTAAPNSWSMANGGLARLSIDVSRLADGAYFLHVSDGRSSSVRPLRLP